MNITTWNMQGANHTTEQKWQTGVLNLFVSKEAWRPDVVVLQEAGGVPSSAATYRIRPPAPGGGTAVVDIFGYGGTLTRPAYSIAFHNWDVLGNRVNLAVVVRGALDPADVALAWGAGPVWRPALGVRVGGVHFFSVHAISPGGADAAGLVTAAAHAAPWYVAGDFNREPNTLAVPAGSTVCPPQGATYSVTNPVARYDYCVRSGGPSVVGTGVGGIVMSDHFPVAYAF